MPFRTTLLGPSVQLLSLTIVLSEGYHSMAEIALVFNETRVAHTGYL